MLPEYELVDLGAWHWIRLSDEKYLVNKKHEQEFINVWLQLH